MSEKRKLFATKRTADCFLEATAACINSDAAVMKFCREFREWLKDLIPQYVESPFFVKWCKSGDQGILLYHDEDMDYGFFLFLHEDDYTDWGVWDGDHGYEIGDEKGVENQYGPMDLNSAYSFLRACDGGLLKNLCEVLSECNQDVEKAISRLTPLEDLEYGPRKRHTAPR